MNLPPLPEPLIVHFELGHPIGYSADQMRAYAEAAVLAMQEQARAMYHTRMLETVAQAEKAMQERCAKACEQHGTGGFSYSAAVRKA